MEWNSSRAKRVCDACFGGDLVAMRAYAAQYLKEGHGSVRPLGARFRELLPGRSRHEFWQKAARQLEEHLHGKTSVDDQELPAWVERAGGRDRWKRWLQK